MRSYSTAGLPPLLPVTVSSSEVGNFSSFRSRNLSTASTASQDSGCGFTMEELVTSEISGVTGAWLEEAQDNRPDTRPKIKVSTQLETYLQYSQK